VRGIHVGNQTGGLDLEIFTHDPAWRMPLGERAALEGVLVQLKPSLSVLVGVAEGGSLEQIVAHSEKVHSVDSIEPKGAVGAANRLAIHTGDSLTLLSAELKRMADEGLSVDFILLNGDRSTEGVRQDVEDLLNSGAVTQTVILIHDVNNETVRAGLNMVHYTAWPKVAHVDLDFIPGYMSREERLRHELWGGLGLVIVDSTRLAYTAGPVMQDRYYSAASLLADARDQVVERESASESDENDEHEEAAVSQEDRLLRYIGELESEILRITSVSAHHEKLWRDMMASVSWSMTRPLRWLISLARKLARK
jgi:hypothetical protein